MKDTSKAYLIKKKRTSGSNEVKPFTGVQILKRKSADEVNKSSFSIISCSVKTYKVRNLAVDLVKYFKDREKEVKYEEGTILSITQNELIEAMIRIGYSRSYIYMRLKVYSASLNRIIDNSKDFDTLEPLLIKRNRSFFDGNAGWVYSLNDRWREVSIEDLNRVFNGV